MSGFHDSLIKFCSSLDRITSHSTKIEKKDSNILDYTEKKRAYQIAMFKTSYKELIDSFDSIDSDDIDILNKMKSRLSMLNSAYQKNDIDEMKKLSIELLSIESDLEYSKKSESSANFKVKNLPSDIAPDMNADLDELQRCFDAKCYRASVVLCARLIETALHRKYFDATGQDILEKNPGIGLGNLIAKLKEKNIPLDPAVSQQVHLVNQIRIFSVHTKKEAFHPSKDQAHAIILYTLEIIRKLF